ncbi:YunG family protein [Rhodococcus qingshengii]
MRDYFGDDLVCGEVHVRGERVDFHWWNRLPDGSEIDLTRGQFSVQEKVIGEIYVPCPTGWTRNDR